MTIAVVESSKCAAGTYSIMVSPSNEAAGCRSLSEGCTQDAPDREAGANCDTGFVRYASATPHQALISHGADSGGDVLYYFQEHQHEIPASAELPYLRVVEAIQEFLREPGEPPASIRWKPVP
jgi:hypothetical protein